MAWGNRNNVTAEVVELVHDNDYLSNEALVDLVINVLELEFRPSTIEKIRQGDYDQKFGLTGGRKGYGNKNPNNNTGNSNSNSNSSNSSSSSNQSNTTNRFSGNELVGGLGCISMIIALWLLWFFISSAFSAGGAFIGGIGSNVIEFTQNIPIVGSFFMSEDKKLEVYQEGLPLVLITVDDISARHTYRDFINSVPEYALYSRFRFNGKYANKSTVETVTEHLDAIIASTRDQILYYSYFNHFDQILYRNNIEPQDSFLGIFPKYYEGSIDIYLTSSRKNGEEDWEEFTEGCRTIIENLYKKDTLQLNMTSHEKIIILAEYVLENVTIDSSGKYPYGYDAWDRGKATMDGVKAFLHQLCMADGMAVTYHYTRLAGIESGIFIYGDICYDFDAFSRNPQDMSVMEMKIADITEVHGYNLFPMDNYTLNLR